MMATVGVMGRVPRQGAQPDSFAAFYRAQHEPMLRLAYLLTQSRAIAEELVQDCFIRVQPRWPELDEPAAYLRRAVTNACYSYHRRRRRDEALVAERSEWAPAHEHDEMWDALAHLAPR